MVNVMVPCLPLTNRYGSIRKSALGVISSRISAERVFLRIEVTDWDDFEGNGMGVSKQGFPG
jgi:hypothetical protein